MAAPEALLYAVDDGIATLTLNRPESLNAMNDDLMSGISDALTQVANDDTVRVVIITGAGRGFCAGADLSAAAEAPPASETNDSPQALPDDAGDVFNGAMRDLMNCPVPTVARVNGAAAGGGFGLALACDITIAAHSAFFVATFGPNLGIVPDLGSTWSIPLRVGRARALGITLLGDRISAVQAEQWGLIWRAVADDNLDAEVNRAAEVLKRSSPSAATRIRHSIDAATQNTFSEQLDLEMVHQGVLIPRNMQEGARAFMDKRQPRFDGKRG